MTNQPRQLGVLITGAGGYLGRLTVAALAAQAGRVGRITALDLRLPEPAQRLTGVEYLAGDVRDPGLAEILRRQGARTVVHLAAVVNPGPKPDRAFLHAVEVEGTRNLLQACLAAGVDHFVYTSSGAAYGYYPDNPEWIDENDAIRGNPEFAYADHKRQVEQMLAQWRQDHPELRQLVLRPGTILGATTNNQITALFDKKLVLGVVGSESPFVFIWDHDVAGAIVKGVLERAEGVYNLAGDGALPMRRIAAILKKPYLPLPAWLLKSALWLLSRLGLTAYGPEQVNFLRYRPVLSNRRLKEEFGYIPQKTSREVFGYFLERRGHGR
ncbi:MAG: SDR family oxidoreductase [Thermodesulfobacteriota bacterium]